MHHEAVFVHCWSRDRGSHRCCLTPPWTPVPPCTRQAKRAPGMEFVGKRSPVMEFLEKSSPGMEFVGKRAPGMECVGKRSP